jgi:transmembrane sensor
MEEEWLLLTGVPLEQGNYDYLYPAIEIERDRSVNKAVIKNNREEKPAEIRRMTPFRITAAASILLLFIAGLFYFGTHKTTGLPISKAGTGLIHDAAPGGNKATLTLADGSTIVLDSMDNGTIARQGTTSIIKLKNGQLEYARRKTEDLPSKELTYNTIATPVGGTYQVVLPDGSKVWLDAASSISFPTAFTEKERGVKLTGQAYFEIEKNSNKPFTIQVGTMKVEVLGTAFNIMAYGDEESVKTTLLNGAVKVTASTGKEVKPAPGEQVQMTRDGELTVSPGSNIQEAIAWKDNRFYFHNADIHDVMRQLARWYNVKVIYNNEVKDRFYANGIPRNMNLSTVLKALSNTGSLHVDIEGSRIIIQP